MKGIIRNHFEKGIRSQYNLLNDEARILTDEIISTSADSRKLSTAITALDPEDIAIVTNTLSGFNNLNYHMFKSGESYIEGCESCNDPNDPHLENNNTPETSCHTLAHCPKFALLREEIFGTHYLNIKQVARNSKPLSLLKKYAPS